MNLPLFLGERNHNPCNLEDFGIPWEGLTGKNGPYCVFVDDEHGLRAGARDLHTKVTLHKLDTFNKLVPRFAPKSENNVPAYVADLCSVTGWGPDETLFVDSPQNLQLLLTAVVHHEQGRVIYPDELMGQATVDALMQNAIGHATPAKG